MQKMSSYLYPNWIRVVADVALFPVRWNIVYQNRIKLYQGVDNVLTVDVKNADQKRIDITAMDLEMVIMDTNGLAVATVPLVNMTTQGLATVTVPSTMLEDISPQFLKFAIYRKNIDNTKTLLYADTQFGAIGNVELVGSAVPVDPAPRYITRFGALTNTMSYPYVATYYSDAVDITKPNFLYPETNEALAFEFITSFLEADVTVEFTKDSVVSTGTTWEAKETFRIPQNSSLNNRIYVFPTLDREYKWARVKYIKRSTGGEFNKVVVTFEKIDQALFDGGNAASVPNLTVDGGWSTT